MTGQEIAAALDTAGGRARAEVDRLAETPGAGPSLPLVITALRDAVGALRAEDPLGAIAAFRQAELLARRARAALDS